MAQPSKQERSPTEYRIFSRGELQNDLQRLAHPRSVASLDVPTLVPVLKENSLTLFPDAPYSKVILNSGRRVLLSFVRGSETVGLPSLLCSDSGRLHPGATPSLLEVPLALCTVEASWPHFPLEQGKGTHCPVNRKNMPQITAPEDRHLGLGVERLCLASGAHPLFTIVAMIPSTGFSSPNHSTDTDCLPSTQFPLFFFHQVCSTSTESSTVWRALSCVHTGLLQKTKSSLNWVLSDDSQTHEGEALFSEFSLYFPCKKHSLFR